MLWSINYPIPHDIFIDKIQKWVSPIMKKEAILSLFNPFGEQVVDDQRKSRYPYQNRRKNASYFKYRGISIFLLFEWGKSDKSSAYPCKKPEWRSQNFSCGTLCCDAQCRIFSTGAAQNLQARPGKTRDPEGSLPWLFRLKQFGSMRIPCGSVWMMPGWLAFHLLGFLACLMRQK